MNPVLGAWLGFALLGLQVSAAPARPPAKEPAKEPAKARVVFELTEAKPKSDKEAPKRRRIDARAGRGSIVKTGKSQATVFLGRNVTLRMKENAVVRLRKFLLDPKTQRLQAYIEVLKGKVLFNVQKLAVTRSSLRLRTPRCVAAVRGTVFVVDAELPAKTRVEVLEGALATFPTIGLAEGQEPPEDAKPIIVEAGQEVDYDEKEPAPKPEPIEPAELASETAWEKEAEPAASEEPAKPEGETKPDGEAKPEKRDQEEAPKKPSADQAPEKQSEPKSEPKAEPKEEGPSGEGEKPSVAPQPAEKDEQPAVIEPQPAPAPQPDEPSGADEPEDAPGSDDSDSGD